MHKVIFTLITCIISAIDGPAQTSPPLPVWASRYESIRPSENVFIVAKNGRMGVVDRKGDPLTKLVYDTIFNFREGIAIVGQGHREVNQFGKTLSDYKYGYLTKTGRLIVPIKYEHIENFSEGLGYVLPSLHEDFWFDKQGKVAILLGDLVLGGSFQGAMAYVEVAHLHIGFKLKEDVYNPFDVRGNYIDHTGRLLVPWKYDTIAPYQPGYLRPVRKNGKWGLLDSLANVAVPLQYDDIDTDNSFFWLHLRRVGIGKHYGFINPKTGQLVVPLRYEATLPSKRPVLWVRQNNKWGIINRQQNTVISPRYNDASSFDEHGISIIKKDSLYGLVNVQGRELTPIQYELIMPFQEDRAVVKRGGRLGFITVDGREIIPTVYDEVSQFASEQAFAKRWGLFITLDQNGHWLRWKLQTQTLLWVLTIIAISIGARWWIRYRSGNVPIPEV